MSGHATGGDRITLRGLTAHGHHGVLGSERAAGQTFGADLTLLLDLAAAGTSDDLAATVDYSLVAEEAVAELAGRACDLIETVAERIAARALAHAGVRGVEVTVHKPEAPIEVPFDSVSVTVVREAVVPIAEETALRAGVPGPDVSVTGGPGAGDPGPEASGGVTSRGAGRASREVVLALGGNLGDASHTMARALAALDATPGIGVAKVSPLLRGPALTVPGAGAQPDYHNAVAVVTTDLSLHELLGVTQAIEHTLGRVRTERWGARTIDIDVVAAGEETIEDDRLRVPHPRAHERAFVLLPWLSLRPDAELPGHGPVAGLVAATSETTGITWCRAPRWWPGERAGA